MRWCCTTICTTTSLCPRTYPHARTPETLQCKKDFTRRLLSVRKTQTSGIRLDSYLTDYDSGRNHQLRASNEAGERLRAFEAHQRNPIWDLVPLSPLEFSSRFLNFYPFPNQTLVGPKAPQARIPLFSSPLHSDLVSILQSLE